MIPKKIHYCWFGNSSLPKEVKSCIMSWKKYAPDYEILEWNENNFDIDSHPFVKTAYDAKAWAFVSDYARLKIIYDNGGIYFDTDVELLKSPDFLLENQCYIGVQQVGHLCTTGLGFGAVKSSPVILKMMEKYQGLSYSAENKEKLACPLLNNAVIEELGYQYEDKVWNSPMVTVYPCSYFDPFAPGDTQNLLSKETVSIHHYAGTWLGKSSRFRRKLIRYIGDERIYRIKQVLKR